MSPRWNEIHTKFLLGVTQTSQNRRWNPGRTKTDHTKVFMLSLCWAVRTARRRGFRVAGSDTWWQDTQLVSCSGSWADGGGVWWWQTHSFVAADWADGGGGVLLPTVASQFYKSTTVLNTLVKDARRSHRPRLTFSSPTRSGFDPLTYTIKFRRGGGGGDVVVKDNSPGPGPPKRTEGPSGKWCPWSLSNLLFSFKTKMLSVSAASSVPWKT